MTISTISGNSPEEPRIRLHLLGMHLKAHGYAVEPVAGGLVVRNPKEPGCCSGQRTAGDTLTCRPRESDSGRYWFFTSWQQPIAEADRITDALVMIKTYLGTPG